MEERIDLRLPKELKDKVLEKANREAVNVSQLLRNFLADWVKEKPKEP